MDFLLYTYGLGGSFIILAGLIMNVIPAGMLLKKPSWLAGKKQMEIPNGAPPSEKVSFDESSTIKHRKSLNGQNKSDLGIIIPNNKMYDIYSERSIQNDAECKHIHGTKKRSNSQGLLTHFQLSSMFPTVSSIELNCRTFNTDPENIFDVDIDYLKRHRDLVYHMMSMETPNVEISYRAILLEVEQDDLWHPDQTEILQEIENIYHHIDKSMEIDEISNKIERPNGPHLKRTLLNGAVAIKKKSESVRAVKRYLRTYKERGLQQLGKIRSLPNMSNIYNEIARKDYVTSKLKQLSNGNEIRIISQLSQFNPKAVLRVLFQLRTLYQLYNDLECCDLCESNEVNKKTEESPDTIGRNGDVCNKKLSIAHNLESLHTNTFKVHIRSAMKLHTNPIFILICCTRALYNISFSAAVTTIVDFASDRGISEEDGVLIIGALSLGDLLGRLCFGWITDKKFTTLPR